VAFSGNADRSKYREASASFPLLDVQEVSLRLLLAWLGNNSSMLLLSRNPSLQPDDLLPPYSRRSFVFPALISLTMLIKLWWDGYLFGRRAVIFITWFLVAAALQFGSRGLAGWSIGLVAQTLLAIVLVLRRRFDDPLV
jgi:hypothetical protein